MRTAAPDDWRMLRPIYLVSPGDGLIHLPRVPHRPGRTLGILDNGSFRADGHYPNARVNFNCGPRPDGRRCSAVRPSEAGEADISDPLAGRLPNGTGKQEFFHQAHRAQLDQDDRLAFDNCVSRAVLGRKARLALPALLAGKASATACPLTRRYLLQVLTPSLGRLAEVDDGVLRSRSGTVLSPKTAISPLTRVHRHFRGDSLCHYPTPRSSRNTVNVRLCANRA